MALGQRHADRVGRGPGRAARWWSRCRTHGRARGGRRCGRRAGGSAAARPASCPDSRSGGAARRAASSRGPAESTKRSRSGQSGCCGSNFRNRVHSTVATSAMPMGMPGWPDLAFSTASMASARMALARAAWLIVMGCARIRWSSGSGVESRARNWTSSAGNCNSSIRAQRRRRGRRRLTGLKALCQPAAANLSACSRERCARVMSALSAAEDARCGACSAWNEAMRCGAMRTAPARNWSVPRSSVTASCCGKSATRCGGELAAADERDARRLRAIVGAGRGPARRGDRAQLDELAGIGAAP